MNTFELPPELTQEQATQLRMAVVVADDSNWGDFAERGWELDGSPAGRDAYCFEHMFPSTTHRANIEASRRAAMEGVCIPPPSDLRADCGRVALARLSGVEAWQPWGYGKSKHPRLHTIGNAEVFGDELFAERIPKAEDELQKVGRLVLRGASQYGWFVNSQSMFVGLLDTTGAFLAGNVDELDLVTTAKEIHEEAMIRQQEIRERLESIKIEPNRDRWSIRRLLGIKPATTVQL